MAQTLKLSTIKKWIYNYTRNKQLVNETNSVTIDLDKIKEFIAYIDAENSPITDTAKRINAVRFYFTRQNNVTDNNITAGGVINDNLNISDAETQRIPIDKKRMALFYDKKFVPQTQIALLGLPVVAYDYTPMPVGNDRLIRFRGVDPDAIVRGGSTARNNSRWFSGKDYIPDEDQVNCLYARDRRSEHSGLCPYNCDGTEKGEEI